MTGSRKGAVEGIGRLARRLVRLRCIAADRAGETVSDTAGEIRRDAQETLRRAPGGLPRLADEVAIEGEGTERTVVVRHPAAPFVEFGTRHSPPRPFLQPAAEAARPPFRKRIMRAVHRIMRGHP